MTLVWIAFAVLGTAVTLFLLKRAAARTAASAGRLAGHRRGEAPPRSGHEVGPEVVVAKAPTAPAPPLAEVSMPPALAGFRLLRADALTDKRRQEYALRFRNVPRPPRLLHHLVSPDFVNAATSAQLVDFIVAEPLIAAKVLSAVNSPRFGLNTPVGNIGQAVTYLGLNTVRIVCLRYLLSSSFKADGPERKQLLDAAWSASSLASALALQLTHRLDIPDRGSLVSAVVLSFLGRLAIIATMPRERLASIVLPELLDRTIAEQAEIGLGAAEIGRLLMDDWGLPETVVDDAAAIDRVLVMPSDALDADRGNRLALCYLCARLGERLAAGRLRDLSAFDPWAEGDADLFHLGGYLRRPALARLVPAIRSPELGAAILPMLAVEGA